MSEQTTDLERAAYLLRDAAFGRSEGRQLAAKLEVIAAQLRISAPPMSSELDRLRAELERERMRLAACGAVASANTPETAAEARKMHDDYRSASCDDVAAAVDREMRLRKENAALREDAERYRWLRQQDWEIRSRKPLAIRVYASEDEDESTNADVLDTAIDAARAALQGAKDE